MTTSWYRVELDGAGNVISCKRVAKAEKLTVSVRYLRAETRKQAIAAAQAWHARRKEHQRRSSARLHAERRAAGGCIRCGKPLDAESAQLCSEHLAAKREWRERQRQGLTLPRAKGDPVAMHEREVEWQRQQYRLTEPLPNILARYDALDGEQTAFREWLVQQIASVEERYPLPTMTLVELP